MAKYLTTLVFLFAAVPAAHAQDAIYLCGTVYQNRPCDRDVSQAPVDLPALGRLTTGLRRPADSGGTPAAQTPPAGYQRGRLADPGTVSQGPAGDANFSPRTRLLELSKRAEYLRMNAPRLVRDFGPDRTMNRIDQTVGELDFLCKSPMVDDDNVKDECRTAQRDLISAQSDVRTALNR